MIPEMPMFLTYNIALVRKGMDLSHQAEGLTHPENFDPLTGAWKPMEMDIAWVRVYQDDTQVVFAPPLSPPSFRNLRHPRSSHGVLTRVSPSSRRRARRAASTRRSRTRRGASSSPTASRATCCPSCAAWSRTPATPTTSAPRTPPLPPPTTPLPPPPLPPTPTHTTPHTRPPALLVMQSPPLASHPAPPPALTPPPPHTLSSHR